MGYGIERCLHRRYNRGQFSFLEIEGLGLVSFTQMTKRECQCIYRSAKLYSYDAIIFIIHIQYEYMFMLIFENQYIFILNINMNI